MISSHTERLLAIFGIFEKLLKYENCKAIDAALQYSLQWKVDIQIPFLI